MSGRFLGYDPALGMTEAFHFDHSSGDFTVETIHNVEPIMEANKRAQNNGDGFTPSRDMKWIARIPNVVIEKWLNELGVNIFDKNHAPAVRRLLNSSDWRHLRTSPGRF